MGPKGGREPHRLSRARIFPAPGAALFSSRTTVDGDLRPHDHDFLEIALALRGAGAHRTAKGAEPLEAGSLVVLRPGAWHMYEACRGLAVHNSGVAPEVLDGEFAWMRHDPLLGHLLWRGPLAAGGAFLGRLDPPRVAEAAAVLRRLERALARERPGGHARALGLFVQALGVLVEAVPRGERERLRRGADPHPAVDRVRRRLESEPEARWRLGDLVAEAGLTRSHFVRLYRRETGMTPMADLARIRNERAARLLLRTPWPVAEVGAAVGWDDPNYFARRFRQRFGLSPSAYRRRFARAG